MPVRRPSTKPNLQPLQQNDRAMIRQIGNIKPQHCHHQVRWTTCVACSTDRSKAVVPVLVLLFVALWFILRGDLLYVFPCVILFLSFSVLLVLRLPRLWKRELILVLFVRLFGLCLFRFVGFLFLLGSGKGCGLWLWHYLDFSLTFFGIEDLGLVLKERMLCWYGRGTHQWCSQDSLWHTGWGKSWACGLPRWHGSSWQRGIAESGSSRLSTLMIDIPGDLVWDLPCVQQASYLEGGPLMWLLPLYLHI